MPPLADLLRQYAPMCIVTWVMLNLASILLPFELTPGFYHWSYAMPAHEVYQVLTDIWSRGCNPQLHYALPILFSIELVGLLLSGLGVYRRCHYATLAERVQTRASQERLDVAMALERRRTREKDEARATRVEGAGGEAEARAETEAEDENDEAEEKRELSTVISHMDEEREKERRESEKHSFGPALTLPYD